MKHLLSLSIIALVMASCGGGDNTVDPDKKVTPTPVEPDPVEPDPVEPDPEPVLPETKARSFDVGSSPHTVKEVADFVYLDGLEFTSADGKVDGYVDGGIGYITLYVDGKTYYYKSDWHIGSPEGFPGLLLSGYNIQYLDQSRKPTAISGYMYDKKFAKKVSSHDPATSYTFSKVSYNYTVSETDNVAAKTVSESNGKITYSADAGTWSGVMGDVKLEGTLDGTKVSGTAELDDMKGAFSGIDGHVSYSTKIPTYPFTAKYVGPVTSGGFSGDNGEDSAFSGSWGYFKN